MHSHGHGNREVSAEARKAGHEVDDVRLGTMVRFGIGLTVLTIVSCLAAWLLFKALGNYESRVSARPTPIQAANSDRQPPNPRLQVEPLKDWLVFKAEQDSVVASYGWVDKVQGKVRLPVDVALDILATRPWPHRPGSYRPTGVSTQSPLGSETHGSPMHGTPTHGGESGDAGHATPGAGAHEPVPSAPNATDGGHH